VKFSASSYVEARATVQRVARTCSSRQPEMTRVGRVHVTATQTRWRPLNVDVAVRSIAVRQKPPTRLAHVWFALLLNATVVVGRILVAEAVAAVTVCT